MTDEKNVESIYPLTPAQQGMLLETLRGGQAGAAAGVFVEQFTWRLDGALDHAALARAFQQLVDRHGALRTAFVWKSRSVPLQIVLRKVAAGLDARTAAADSAGRDEELAALVAEERARGFDLSRAPLARLAVLQLEPERHAAVLTFHHAVVDGWSVPILLGDLMELYAAAVRRRPPALSKARTFQDFVVWLTRQDVAAAEKFWRARLEGVVAATPLGRAAAASPTEPSPRYGEMRLAVAPEVTEALGAVARRHRVTISALVQAIWALQLARYSGSEVVVFGATTAGRPAALRLEGTVGMFTNTLPVRVDVSPAAPFPQLLMALQQYGIALRQFDFTPGDVIASASDVPPGLPLYESLLVFQNQPGRVDEARLEAGLPRGHGYRYVGARTRFPLTLLAIPGASLDVIFIYDRWRIDDAAASSMVAHFRVLASGLAESPDESCGAIMGRIPLAEVPAVATAPSAAERDDRDIVDDPPCTVTEARVAQIWSELLGLPNVGRSRSLFDIGGASLLAMRIVDRLQSAFGVTLPLHLALQSPTVATMAALIDARPKGAPAAAAAPMLVPAPGERHEPFALTDLQRAYWLGQVEHFELGGIVAHAHEVVDVTLDVERLRAALAKVIARHEMLRAVVLEGGRLQVLADVPPYPLEIIDARGLEPSVAAARLDEVHRRVAERVRPLDAWPLFDVCVVLVDGGRARLHIRIPLLLTDGASAGIVKREVWSLYENPDVALPPLGVSFRDYVVALEKLEQDDAYRKAAAYWQARGPRLPPPPELPLARAPSSMARQSMSRRTGRLSRSTWSAFKARAGAVGLTPNSALVAAYSAILAAWSKEPSFTLNLLLGDRLPLHPDLGQVVGNFSSTLLLEVAPGARDESFANGALRLQAQLWQDLEHRSFSGVRALAELNRANAQLGRAAMPVVFASTFGLDDGNGEEQPSSLAEEPVYGSLQTPQVWLDHNVFEVRGELVFNWDVAEPLFPPGMIDAMFGAYRDLVARLAADDVLWRGPLGSLVPKNQLTDRAVVNATATDERAKHALLHQPFEAQAIARPEAIAIVAPDRTMSYGELSRRAGALEAQLRARGAKPNELVAVVMEKGWEQVVAVLAVLGAGAAYLPLDPASPPERLQRLLRGADVRVAVVQAHLADALSWLDGVDRVVVDREAPVAATDAPPEEARSPLDLAYVVYTSGSTGEPKGVMIDHRGALNTVLDINRRFGVGPGDRVLALSALNFDLSVWDVFGVLGAGGAIVLPSPAELRDPARWAALIASAGVTVWNTVPALMTMLVEHLDAHPASALRSLRVALWSGDWIPVTLPGRLRAHLPKVAIVSLGGATEASIWSIYHAVGDVDPSWTSIPYGKPLSNQGWAVLDEAKRPRPVWVTGELHITGIGVAQGYFRDEARTRERFDVDPGSGARRYATGDLGRYRPDGNIELLGRNDLQVKIQGYRVELGEIEAALAQHPDVRACAVVAVGETRGAKRLAAFVVPSSAPEPTPDVDALRRHMRSKLPEYMVPPSWAFLESLPLTINGKVDRGVLTSLGAAPARARRHVAPRDATELALVEIWEEALEQRPLGVVDNFFELGGQSVIAVRLVSQIKARFGRDLPLATLLERPTIEELASVLRRAADASRPTPLVPIRKGGALAPLFLVHPVGGSAMCYVPLAQELGSDQPVFALQSPGLDGETAPHASIEAMASDYLRVIRAVQPRGPFLLGGWSLGGAVAYEMARQLVAQGERASLVAMIDTAVPSHQASYGHDDDDALSLQFARDLARSFGASFDADDATLRELDVAGRLDHLFRLARAAEIVPEDGGRERVRDLHRVFCANMRALVRYVPGPYDGAVALARGADEGPRDRTLGWSAAGAAALTARDLPGDHYTMMTAPRSDALAAWLRELLAGARPSRDILTPGATGAMAPLK